VNNTDHYLNGLMYLQVRAFAENLAAPVPEPPGGARLLGGLVALGLHARCRAWLTTGRVPGFGRASFARQRQETRGTSQTLGVLRKAASSH
jgi:hypothetical protein